MPIIYDDFKKLLDSTTKLINSLKECQKDEIEEIEMRIESNIHALQLIAYKIEDPETKDIFLRSIQSLRNTKKDNNDANINKNEIFNLKERIKRENIKNVEKNNLIDEELLKNSTKLKDKANEFKASLQADKKIIEKLGGKMNKNSQESAKSLKILETTDSKIKSSTFISISFLIFIFMYFLIRYF